MRKERIYVCHTFYHVYVSLLKEFALGKEKLGGATIVLSKMSNQFGDLKTRLEKSGIFEEVYEFDEKRDTFFPELAKYRKDSGNFIKNLRNRIIFTKKFPKCLEPYIPVNFKEYEEIYVYCDSDPIGYYLNYKKIKYHAMEDGLNCIANYDTARYDNRGHFKLKVFLAKLNLIFIQNGYSKYCIDMEVNDISLLKYSMKKYKQVPRGELQKRLTKEEHDIITDIFVENKNEIIETLQKTKDLEETCVVLTEPLCTLDIRKQIFEDICKEYGQSATIVLKPHPRDEMDYEKEFPGYLIINKMVPMEVLNYLTEKPFDKVVAVLTELGGIQFAKEKVRLGPDFMDKYETPEVHRQNEQI